MSKLEKNYVSEIDKVLQKFDADHPEKSASQLQEIKKHERIMKLRDEVQEESKDKSDNLWDGF